MLTEGAEEKMQCSVAGRNGGGALRGRERAFLLAASVGAYEGEVLGLTQVFHPFLLTSLSYGHTLWSGHSDWFPLSASPSNPASWQSSSLLCSQTPEGSRLLWGPSDPPYLFAESFVTQLPRGV